jgi:hypothetical protein
MKLDVLTWWSALSTIALLNMILWWSAMRELRRSRAELSSSVYRDRRLQLLLSGTYVVVCAFRAFLPRADVQRICLVDSFFSSVFVGRSVATVAELAFALQWALFVRKLGDATQIASVRRISLLLVPLIVFAETSSWYAVVSTNFLGNAIEQSTWTLSGLLIAYAYARVWLHVSEDQQRYLRRTAFALAGFIWFMSTVDVPHYFAHWRADQLAGKVYLPWSEGLRDSAQRWIVEYAWAPWRDEIAWMTLYFSVGVWVSISFAWARAAHPQPLAALEDRLSGRASAAAASGRL